MGTGCQQWLESKRMDQTCYGHVKDFHRGVQKAKEFADFHIFEIDETLVNEAFGATYVLQDFALVFVCSLNFPPRNLRSRGKPSSAA